MHYSHFPRCRLSLVIDLAKKWMNVELWASSEMYRNHWTVGTSQLPPARTTCAMMDFGLICGGFSCQQKVLRFSSSFLQHLICGRLTKIWQDPLANSFPLDYYHDESSKFSLLLRFVGARFRFQLADTYRCQAQGLLGDHRCAARSSQCSADSRDWSPKKPEERQGRRRGGGGLRHKVLVQC